MAEGSSDQQDKTEAATPRRAQQAREQGQVPISRELITLAGLAAGFAAIFVPGPDAARSLAKRLSMFLANADSIRLAGPPGLTMGWQATVYAAAPVVLVSLLTGVAIVLLQTGFFVNFKAFKVNLGRISPAAGIHRLAGSETLVEGIKSLAKTGIFFVIIWQIICSYFRSAPILSRQDPRSLLANLMEPSIRIVGWVLVMQGAIAALDLVWVRFRHSRQLRMSRQDIRDEFKETDGDPKIKARVRQVRMQRARKRMMAAVPKATVVITNPTHYAVALVYDRLKNAAPLVVAKGVDAVAARIREVAREHGVPVVENPPLARALYRIEVDGDIPSEHYQAVASIIAYVWRLKAPWAAGRQN